MNKFRLVVWSLNWSVALVAGFIGVIWYLDASRLYWLELAHENPTGGLVLFLIALITVLLNVSYMIFRHLYGYPMRTHIPVRGTDPSVTVSLFALREALTRALQHEPEVHSVDVELKHDRAKRRITQVMARGTVWDGPDILQTTLKMQQVLRRRFREIVDPEEEPRFEVALDRFRFVGKQQGFRERIDRIRETFRGPQYPVGG
jgi:hypothetical protein